MKDLKENIQKNNMKKLVLSAVLGMFCYCTNNADNQPAPQPKEDKGINEVLTVMLVNQLQITKAKEPIEAYGKTIYLEISANEKVTKGKVLTFIGNQIVSEEKENDMKILEQYFHLEEIKDDNDECNEGNLTEIFWDNGEEGKNAEINNEEVKGYFQAIINAEKAISGAFKGYYEEKKAKKGKVENDVVIEEIMQECCGEEQGEDLVTNFIENLRKMELKEINKEAKGFALAIIGKRITLSNEKERREKDFKSFLKQKIGEEEKKEEKKEEIKEGDKLEDEDIHQAKKGGCPCCNC